MCSSDLVSFGYRHRRTFDPHVEAWLIDDAVAVREGLSLEPDAEVPNVRRCRYPKDTLEELHSSSPRADDSSQDVWGDIARGLDRARCAHGAETGLEAFAEDLIAEMAPLLV